MFVGCSFKCYFNKIDAPLHFFFRRNLFSACIKKIIEYDYKTQMSFFCCCSNSTLISELQRKKFAKKSTAKNLIKRMKKKIILNSDRDARLFYAI